MSANDWDWNQVDSSEAPRTVVLLGAGASVDAGLPTTADLHQRLLDRMPALYKNLADLVFGPGFKAVDVERLFRIIEFIHSLETVDRPDEQRSGHDFLDLALLVEEWRPPLRDYLQSQRTAQHGSPTGILIDSLWAALYEILWIPARMEDRDLNYLAWMLMCMRGGTVATLNYDNTLERVNQVGAGMQLLSEPAPFVRRDIPGFALADRNVRLIKLHGSLNWRTDRETGDVYEQLEPGPAANPGIIFGAGNKLRPGGPYLDLLEEFRQCLGAATRLTVIGYGFRDAHVNELIRRWGQARGQRELRINQLGEDELPKWIPRGPDLQLRVIRGTARDNMTELMAPTPLLMREG